MRPLFLFFITVFLLHWSSSGAKSSILKRKKKLNTIRQPRSPGFIPDGTLVSSRVRQCVCACVCVRLKIALVASVRASLHTGRNTRGFSLLLLLPMPPHAALVCLSACLKADATAAALCGAQRAALFHQQEPLAALRHGLTHANARTHALALLPLSKSRVVPVSPTQEARARGSYSPWVSLI